MTRDPLVLIPAGAVVVLAVGFLGGQWLGRRLATMCACQSRAVEPEPALPAPQRDAFRAALTEWQQACDRAGFYVETTEQAWSFGDPAPFRPRRHYPAPPPGWFAGTGETREAA